MMVQHCMLIWIALKFFRESGPGLEVIKLEFILRLKIKRNEWLLEDKCQSLRFILSPILYSKPCSFCNFSGGGGRILSN